MRFLDTMMSETEITVLLAYPHKLIAEAIARLLTERDYKVIRHIATIDEVFEVVALEKPGIILLHPSLLGEEMSTIHSLVNDSTGHVVVLTDQVHGDAIPLKALQAGAKGCLSYADAPEQFIESLRLLLLGATVVSPGPCETLWQTHADEAESRPWTEISQCEQQLAVLVAAGLPTARSLTSFRYRNIRQESILKITSPS